MKVLAESFKDDGFQFQQITRLGDVVLFAKIAPHHSVPSYEVVFVQYRKERTFPDGRVVPEHEGMPSPEQWGTYAWTPGTWRMALDMFKAKCWDRKLPNEGVHWRWPDNRRIPPENAWILDPVAWTAKNGDPGVWIDSRDGEE